MARMRLEGIRPREVINDSRRVRLESGESMHVSSIEEVGLEHAEQRRYRGTYDELDQDSDSMVEYADKANEFLKEIEFSEAKDSYAERLSKGNKPVSSAFGTEFGKDEESFEDTRSRLSGLFDYMMGPPVTETRDEFIAGYLDKMDEFVTCESKEDEYIASGDTDGWWNNRLKLASLKEDMVKQEKTFGLKFDGDSLQKAVRENFEQGVGTTDPQTGKLRPSFVAFQESVTGGEPSTTDEITF